MKLVVPLTIPNTFEISVTPKPSWIVRTIGITPATAASKRSCTPASRATAKSSSPCLASSCLLAVTTGRPARIASITKSRAGSVPPISSTRRSERSRIAPKSPSERVRAPSISGRRPVGDGGFVARAVEHRAHVVRHAAVDRDVGADARDLLDGADPVGGDAGVGDQRAAGLDQDPHPLAEDLGDAADLDVDVGVDRGRLVLGRISDI